jgi:large subunit ribosomal protein L15
MIKLETLHGDKGARQKKKRVGRGESSGQGRTAGKGNKGAQARTGTAKRKGFEGGQTPIARRLPKRGFSHLAWSLREDEVNVSQLNRFDEGMTVNPGVLAAARLIKRNTQVVKILGTGELKKKLTVVAHGFSASAREKIEKAGGACETQPAHEKKSGE